MATRPASESPPRILLAGCLAFGGFLLASAALTQGRLRTELPAIVPLLAYGLILWIAAQYVSAPMAFYLGVVAALFDDFFFNRPYGVLHVQKGGTFLASLALVALGTFTSLSARRRRKRRTARAAATARTG